MRTDFEQARAEQARAGGALAKHAFVTDDDKLAASPRRRRRRRGVTLVEVLIVVAIMAIIAGGATILVFPAFKKAKIQNAKIGAEAVRGAVELYLADEGGTCPQMKDLVDAKKLDPKKTDDPWGKPYRIVCGDSDDIRVYSNGQDGKENNEDDVRDDFKPSDVKRVAEL